MVSQFQLLTSKYDLVHQTKSTSTSRIYHTHSLYFLSRKNSFDICIAFSQRVAAKKQSQALGCASHELDKKTQKKERRQMGICIYIYITGAITYITIGGYHLGL